MKSRRGDAESAGQDHDSFLDIVANIVGILIILVMVVTATESRLSLILCLSATLAGGVLYVPWVRAARTTAATGTRRPRRRARRRHHGAGATKLEFRAPSIR